MAQSPAFSKSADRNKEVILEQLQLVLSSKARVLEIASGTGQHGDYFTQHIRNVIWQPSDRDLDAYGLAVAVDEMSRSNLCIPFVLDIGHWSSLRPRYDAVFSANCIHIIGWNLVGSYIEGAARSLKPGGQMILYGPFKYEGEFTTDSNAQFDAFLKQQDPASGIRDFEAVHQLAEENGLIFHKDLSMPANNQFIVWRKPERKNTSGDPDE